MTQLPDSLENMLVPLHDVCPTLPKTPEQIEQLMVTLGRQQRLHIAPALAEFEDKLNMYKSKIRKILHTSLIDGKSNIPQILSATDPEFQHQYGMNISHKYSNGYIEKISLTIAQIIGAIGLEKKEYFLNINGNKNSLPGVVSRFFWGDCGTDGPLTSTEQKTLKEMYPQWAPQLRDETIALLYAKPWEVSHSSFQFDQTIPFNSFQLNKENGDLNGLYKRFLLKPILTEMRADEQFMQPLSPQYITAALGLINQNLDPNATESDKKLAAQLKIHASLGIAGVVQECAQQLGLVEKDSLCETVVIDHLDSIYQKIRRLKISPEFVDFDSLQQQQEIVSSLQSIGTSAKQVLVGYANQKTEAQYRQEFLKSLQGLGQAIYALAQRPTVVCDTYINQYNLTQYNFMNTGNGNMGVNLDFSQKR